MNILKDKRNDLLRRRELEFVMLHDKNPGFEAVVKEFCSKENVPEENVCVKSLHGNFGRSEFHVDVFVYDSLEDKNKVELNKKSKKK